MKKIFTTLLLFSIISLSHAQKTGWYVESLIDDYTQESSKICVYYKNNLINAIFYPNDNIIKIVRLLDGLYYWDDTWDACMNYRGRIPSFKTSISQRFIFKDKYEEEEYDDIYVDFTKLELPNDNFGEYFTIYVDVENLKKAKSVSYKWYDRLEHGEMVLNISLIGFTACYNKSLK